MTHYSSEDGQLWPTRYQAFLHDKLREKIAGIFAPGPPHSRPVLAKIRKDLNQLLAEHKNLPTPLPLKQALQELHTLEKRK